MPKALYRPAYTRKKPKTRTPKPRSRAPSPLRTQPPPSPPSSLPLPPPPPRPTPPISPPDSMSSASSSPPSGQRASVSPKKGGRPRRPSPQRSLPVFQCFICPLFSASREEFVLHLQNATHRRLEEKQIKIQCNGGGDGGARCLWRRSGVVRLVEHLTKVDFHYVDAEAPACILTQGPMGSLMVEDEETPEEMTAGTPGGGGPGGAPCEV